MEKKLQKPYLTNYNLQIKDIWQVYYQTLLIILLKEFIKLNVDIGMIIKKCEMCGIKSKHCMCCLEYINFKGDLIQCECLCCNKNHQKKV